MDIVLTMAVLTLPAAIVGLQTCSSGTETSSTQILLDLSTTQINTGGGMCSCRLTVSQTTQVEMFTVTGSWTPACDTYMTIQKWRTSTQCRNGAVQTPPSQTNTVATGVDIWILVVATKPGVRGLSGKLQFKVKQPSGQLNIECYEPNTNSSTTTTPSTTLTSTNVVTTTSPLVTTTRKITTSTHRETVRSPDTTRVQPTVPPGSSAGTSTIEASTTQDYRAGYHACNDDFPGGIFAAGVATGVVLVLTAGGLYIVISRRQWCHQKPDDIPISEAHPTYSGLKSRAEEPTNTYDKIGQNLSKGVDNPYINVS